ncbi:hypothetical protein PHPALM_30854 [Phytophthora palmivora]|uniref:M96 mating-specific protein family n=1 Tax=Phytophthora palmivora TaxID=4796 RepID=A0A2P4X430_9STRA|nr:hypothetical protein PHPALM_30854 [Phytophthora palmivora]
MVMGGEQAPEVAAVAAFLSDISTFLSEERGHSSAFESPHELSNSETLDNHVTSRTVQEAKIEAKCPLDAEAERKRALRNLKAGKRRDAYRQRLKEEWQTLRGEEVELIARLEELLQRQRTFNEGLTRSVWRAMAIRQLEGRCMAEAHQERLKAAVKRRREMIHDVENMLQKRLREMTDTDKEERSRYKNGMDERLFDSYLDELDVIYAKTDNAFHSCETEPIVGLFMNTKPLKKKDGETEYFENVGELHIPFNFERVCLVLWETTNQSYRQLDREEYHEVENVENTIAVRFRVECKLHSGNTASLLTHFVARRYFEEGRAVIIWRELWEGEGEFHGMHSDETGWCIIQPHKGTALTVVSPTDGTDNFSTMVKTCVRLVPIHITTNVSLQPDFDDFTEILVTSGKEDNLQVEQMMEQLKLRD